MVIKIVALALFWAAHLLENYLNLKVTKTAYIRALPKWMRWFAVAPAWSWVNKGISGAAMTFAALVAPGGLLLSTMIGLLAVSKCLNVYRGLLVYVREHNLKFYQTYKKRNPKYVPTRADRFKDLAVKITRG